MNTKFTLLLCVLTTSICFGQIEVEELNKSENKILEIETKFDPPGPLARVCNACLTLLAHL